MPFLGAFCHKGKCIFLKSTLNFASFDTYEVNIVREKNYYYFFYSYIVKDPKSCDQR
jgi:hypothetical protein